MPGRRRERDAEIASYFVALLVLLIMDAGSHGSRFHEARDGTSGFRTPHKHHMLGPVR
jgi:hypothetical protein